MSTTVRIPPRTHSYRSGYSSITVTSAGQCYTNVDSTTYATFNSQYYSTSSDIFAIHLRNFDLSLVPEDADITRLYLKLKMRRSNSALASGFRPAALLHSSSGQTYTFGSWNPQVTPSNATVTTTFQMATTNSTVAKSAWSTIKSAGAYFSIAINIGRSNPAYYYVYGAEIAVTYNEKNINKVVYGDKTLIDLTSDTIDASKMLSGITAHDKYGAIITGTISTKSSSNVTFSNTTVTVPSGYYASQVSKTATDADLVAENIKKDINIFGVTGTYEGGGGSAPTYQTKTVSPTESQQTVTPDSNYDALSSVTVNAISSTYVGSGITQRDETDLTASGATVTVPAGYYAEQETKSVTSGSATGPSSLSGSSATVSTGTNTLTLTKTGVTTTPTVSAGYISGATASTATVTLTASVTTKAAATITPGTSNQTIAAGTYLTGTQTIAGDADLVAGNIKNGVQIFGVTGNLAFITYYTDYATPSSSLGSDGDIYLKVS